MADEIEIVKSPITDIIKNSIMKYATTKKNEMPKEVKQIIESGNSRWNYVGFDNISCEYLFESKDGKELIKYNYKTKELLSYNSEEMFHRFFNPANKTWEIYIPQKGMHYNIKTNRWEYYNVATDEWLGTKPKAFIKDDDENKNYTVSYDREKNIYKYSSKEVSAIYIVDDKIWAIHNKISNKTAYINATNGKEMVLDKEKGKFYIKESLEKTTNQESKINDGKTNKAETNNDNMLVSKTDEPKSDTEQKVKEADNKEKSHKDADLALVATKVSFFSKIKKWFKEKIYSLKSSNSANKNEPKSQPINTLNKKPVKLSNIEKDNQITPDGKFIYRSEATKQKIREKENKKLLRRLKLAELKKGLRFTDAKKSISLLAVSGLFALGAAVNLVNEGLKDNQNKNSVSISENFAKNNSQNLVNTDNQEKQIKDTQNTEIKNNTESDIKAVDFQENEINIYMVPAGTTYASSSKGDGTKGIFKEDTTVGIYNRAIVKNNDDGSKEIVLSTDGKTWEEYSKDSGISMEEIKKIRDTEKNVEMVAVSVPNTNSISDTYGWIESKELKKLEISLGDNTQILQKLTEHENER